MDGFVPLFMSLFYLQTALGAEFRVAKIYGSNMILQMEPKSSNIWGYGEAGAEVILSEGNEINKTVVQSDEMWSLRLPPSPEGGPHEFTLKHTDLAGVVKEVVMADVWFGDIWFCAGEENMEFFMNSIFNSTEEMEFAETYSNIRLLHVGHDTSFTEFEEHRLLEYPWSRLTNVTIPWFSALCLIYAEQLSDALDGRPIGVVEASWTRTPLQAWVPANVTAECQLPNSSLAIDNSAHNVYHNAAIYPLTKLAIRGVIWNQGETSEELSMEHFTCATTRMVQHWRNSFVDATIPALGGAFPFGIVQLGAHATAPSANISRVRLAQSAMLDAVNFPDIAIPETFTAVTYDLVETDPPSSGLFDFQYSDKRTVATRLAKAALELLKPTSNSRSASGPKLQISSMSYDSETSVAVLTYDSDVTFLGDSGFGYGWSFDNLTDSKIISTSGRSFTVHVDQTAQFLVFAHHLTPCSYFNCSVYSADEDKLPAAVIMMPWNSASQLTPMIPIYILIKWIF